MIAVFIALGIGILVGVSMGESSLVANQLSVIEDLEGRIGDYRQENARIAFRMAALQEDLHRWDDLKDKYLCPLFRDTLGHLSLTLIAGGDYPPGGLLDFLEECGCRCRTVYLSTDGRAYAVPAKGDLSLGHLKEVLLGEEREGRDIVLLAGDIPFVMDVLKEEALPEDTDFTWIVLAAEDEEDVGGAAGLPGGWHVLDRSQTFFTWVELWELLVRF